MEIDPIRTIDTTNFNIVIPKGMDNDPFMKHYISKMDDDPFTNKDS